MKIIPTTCLSILLVCILISCQQAAKQPAETASAISIHTDFEGGSLGTIEQLEGNHWRCGLAGESDWDDRNRQASWYYFRVEGARGQSLTLDLTDLVGEYNYKPGTYAVTSETRPVISYDQTTWQHLTDAEVEWQEEAVELRLKFTPKADTFWIAHQPPYTTEDLDQLLATYEDHPSLSQRSIGQTAEGKPIPLLTITHSEIPREQKHVVWLMARQHSWESGTSWVMEGAIRYLMETDEGEALLDRFVFQLIPLGDPDGVARGGVRFNQFGHDLNRNWDLVKPEEMPEIQAQKEAIVQEASEIDFFLTLHNTESADYIQGPDLPVGKAFWAAMVQGTSFESEEGLREMPETTTAGKAGRMTVNQALWAEEQLPAYLMELKVEKVNKLGARRSVQDWLALGPGLIKALATAVP